MVAMTALKEQLMSGVVSELSGTEDQSQLTWLIPF